MVELPDCARLPPALIWMVPLPVPTSPVRVMSPVLVVSASGLPPPVSWHRACHEQRLVVHQREAGRGAERAQRVDRGWWVGSGWRRFPHSQSACGRPTPRRSGLIAPAEIRSTTFAALTLPASVMSPVLVVSASVLAPPVSCTGPATSNDLLFTSAKPAVVLNAPNVSIRLVGCVRLAKVPALPVRLATGQGAACLGDRTGRVQAQRRGDTRQVCCVVDRNRAGRRRGCGFAGRNVGEAADVQRPAAGMDDRQQSRIHNEAAGSQQADVDGRERCQSPTVPAAVVIESRRGPRMRR